MNEATNKFSRVVEYKGCAIDPISTAGSWDRAGVGFAGYLRLLG